MKKLFIFLMLGMFLFSFVSAVAPVTTIFTGDIGINVEVNVMPSYKLGEARWSVIHLFNTTNGFQMTPTTHPDIMCAMHLRNPQGFEIQNVNATTHLDHWDLNGSSGGIKYNRKLCLDFNLSR